MQKFTSSTKKEELKKMKDSYVQLRNFTFVQLGFCIAALITALVKAMVPSVLCLIAMVLFRLTLHRKAAANYTQSIIDASLACSVGPKFDQFELSAKGGTGITREEILAAQLLPVRTDASGSIGFYQGIRGTSKGMEISLNDTTIPLPRTSGDKGSGVICGVWMHFSLQKDTDRNFRILSKELLPDNLRKEFFKSLTALRGRTAAKAGFHEKMYVYEEFTAPEEVPDPAENRCLPEASGPAENTGIPEGSGPAEISGIFEGSSPAESPEVFEVSAPAEKNAARDSSADNKDPGFQPFNASFISAVDRLFRKTSGTPGISVQGSTVDIFIKDRVLAPNYRVNAQPNENFLSLDPIPEFRDALDVVRAL